MTKAKKLKELLDGSKIIMAPGAYDAWSARLIEKAGFSAEEIHLMRATINRLRNERIANGQYTDAAEDRLLK